MSFPDVRAKALDEPAMGRALKIINGELYDPSNGVGGAVKEICIQGGKVVPSCAETPEVLCEAIPAGASHGDSRRFHRGDIR